MTITKLTTYIFILQYLLLNPAFAAPPKKVEIYPAPKGEVLSQAYKISVDGKSVPVYNVKVGAADHNRRFKAVDDLLNSADYFDVAAFAYFDLQGSAVVTVTIDQPTRSAKILPASAGITARISNRSISFTVSSPKNLTIEINGEWVKSLHLFVNPIETNRPDPKDPDVIYFGPGIHNVNGIVVGNNKTVYIAGGAILRAGVGADEKYNVGPGGLKNYHAPNFLLTGSNIKFRGRGIIDASATPTHGRHIMDVTGWNISIEGVILKNPAGWTMPLFGAEKVRINNIKILGYRANSDGINICNSRDVTVEKCFVRSNDDLIVVKAFDGQEVKGVVVKDCVLWNQLAHALMVGPELRANVSDIVFKNCDIIHDQGREWSLRVFHADSTLVSNIRFENIRIESESLQFISLWIGKNASTLHKTMGKIKGVTFKNITASGTPLVVDIYDGNAVSGIQNVNFENIKINGKKMKKEHVKMNKGVMGLTVQ